MGYFASITADGKTLYETKEGNSRVLFDAVMNYKLFKGGIFEPAEEKIRKCVKHYHEDLLRFAEYHLEDIKTALTLIKKGKCVQSPSGVDPNGYFVEDNGMEYIIGFGIEEYYKFIGRPATDVPKFFEENKLNMPEAIAEIIKNFQKEIIKKENHIKGFEKFLREISEEGETEIRVFNHTLTDIRSQKKFRMEELFCLHIIMGYPPFWMRFDSKEDSLAEFKKSLKYLPKDRYFAEKQTQLKQMISRAETVVIDASY